MKKFCFMLIIFFITNNLCHADTRATVTVTATILQGQSSISISPALLDFGGVSGSSDNRRFQAGPVAVSYFASGSAWTIRVYTQNSNQVAGLIGVTDPSSSIPLKAWCDNYGPLAHRVGVAPNEENNYFWNGYDFNGNGTKTDVITNSSISEPALDFDVNGDGDALDSGLGTAAAPVGEEPSWLRIPDYQQMTADPYTWRRLLTGAWTRAPGSGSGSGGETDDPNKFPVFFGIDVTGIAPQQYRTTLLIFEIINQ